MCRLRNAHEFFPKADFVRPADLLYQVGVVSQLALTACLVATGWSDDDCRRHVGQDVGKAFFLANGGGLQFHSESFARLMPLLSPYGRWRPPAAVDWRERGTIDAEEVRFTAIGRASCRERGCQYVWISWVAVSLKQQTNK